MQFILVAIVALAPPDFRVISPDRAYIREVSSQLVIKRPSSLVPIQKRMGEMKCVVLLGEFSDMSFSITEPVNYFKEMFFRTPKEPSILYPYPSMNQFYQESSMGKFGINGDVYGIYPLPDTHDCYGSGACNDFPPCSPTQDAGTCRGALNFVHDLVTRADSDVDFSLYDTNPADGVVDCLIAVHPGYGGEQSCGGDIQYCDDIWTLTYSYSNAGLSPIVTDDGVYVDAFIVGPEKTMVPEGAPIDMGVYAHEFGHILGLPDLYDTDFSGCGIGVYGLMGYGVHGPSPSYPSAWSRLKLGWVDADEGPLYGDGACRYEMKSIIDEGRVLKLWKFDETPGDEYFLVEFRPAVGFDSDFEKGGLLIWHVDEKMDSNDNEWYPGHEGDKHYLVALEQADGLFQLETGKWKCNEPDPNDFYRTAEDEFTPHTTPNSNYYDGTFTGIWVRNITTSIENAYLTFDFGNTPVFSPPVVTTTPQTAWSVDKEYTYQLSFSGNPEPELTILQMPEGATFSYSDFTFRWTPKRPGKYSFSIVLKNCLEEVPLRWNVTVKVPALEYEGDTPVCLLSYAVNDKRILNVLRGVKSRLVKTASGKVIVRGYYLLSQFILGTSSLKIIYLILFKTALLGILFLPYFLLFRLQKKLFRENEMKDEG